MHTIFEAKNIVKPKITFEELANETSKVLPNREELIVMDYSMLNTPYYAAPYGGYGTNMNNMYAGYTPYSYGNTPYYGAYNMQSYNMQPYSMPVPPDYSHYNTYVYNYPNQNPYWYSQAGWNNYHPEWHPNWNANTDWNGYNCDWNEDWNGNWNNGHGNGNWNGWRDHT